MSPIFLIIVPVWFSSMIPDFVRSGNGEPVDFAVRIAVNDVWVRKVGRRGISRVVLLENFSGFFVTWKRRFGRIGRRTRFIVRGRARLQSGAAQGATNEVVLLMEHC